MEDAAERGQSREKGSEVEGGDRQSHQRQERMNYSSNKNSFTV